MCTGRKVGLEIIELNGFHTVPPGTPLSSMGHLEGAVELVEEQKCRWVSIYICYLMGGLISIA